MLCFLAKLKLFFVTDGSTVNEEEEKTETKISQGQFHQLLVVSFKITTATPSFWVPFLSPWKMNATGKVMKNNGEINSENFRTEPHSLWQINLLKSKTHTHNYAHKRTTHTLTQTHTHCQFVFVCMSLSLSLSLSLPHTHTQKHPLTVYLVSCTKARNFRPVLPKFLQPVWQVFVRDFPCCVESLHIENKANEARNKCKSQHNNTVPAKVRRVVATHFYMQSMCVQRKNKLKRSSFLTV